MSHVLHFTVFTSANLPCSCAWLPPPPHLCSEDQGTTSRVLVSVGYLSVPITSNASLRWGQVQCPPGAYCTGGLLSVCPRGVFGNTSSLSTPLCSGPCSEGYFCPSNSTSPTQHECGEGVTVGASVYCPLGSGLPLLALPGEETTGGTSPTTRTTALPCASGSYCIGGVRALCPAGRFGCANRLSDPACNGPCTASFFCVAGSLSSQG